jgi:hypothetical protein
LRERNEESGILDSRGSCLNYLRQCFPIPSFQIWSYFSFPEIWVAGQSENKCWSADLSYYPLNAIEELTEYWGLGSWAPVSRPCLALLARLKMVIALGSKGSLEETACRKLKCSTIKSITWHKEGYLVSRGSSESPFVQRVS